MPATMPDVLVTTDWVAQHAKDAGVRIVEVDVDTTAYDQGHVPGSAGWNWTTELCDTLVRDIIPGEILAPPGLPETCQRGGHIPGAKSIPWGKNCKDDGTFKSFDELKALYAGQEIRGDQPIIAYCRIGERSSLTWFVLKHLLGFN